jgi:hypothetical protein
MKVALCLSGKPRSHERGFEYHKSNLLTHYDVDVFVHTWNDINDNVLDFINSNYKPKRMITTNVFNNENLKKYPDIHPDWPARNVVHMLYSVFRSNHEKRQYELEQGFTYDVVIRSRFDYALNRTLPLNDVSANKVYVPKDMVKGQIPPNGIICNDQFAYGSSATMDLYSNTFWMIDLATSLNCPMSGEDLLSANLQIHGLIREKMVYIDMNYPFPPGKYNCTPHSLLRDDL